MMPVRRRQADDFAIPATNGGGLDLQGGIVIRIRPRVAVIGVFFVSMPIFVHAINVSGP